MDYYFEIELTENENELYEEAQHTKDKAILAEFGALMVKKLKEADKTEAEL